MQKKVLHNSAESGRYQAFARGDTCGDTNINLQRCFVRHSRCTADLKNNDSFFVPGICFAHPNYCLRTSLFTFFRPRRDSDPSSLRSRFFSSLSSTVRPSGFVARIFQPVLPWSKTHVEWRYGLPGMLSQLLNHCVRCVRLNH